MVVSLLPTPAIRAREQILRKGEPLIVGLLILMIMFMPMSNAQAEPSVSTLNKVERWFVLLDYDEDRFQVKKEDVHGFDMAVLDPDHHPSLQLFKPGQILMAYISVGEAENYRSYWKRINKKPWVVGSNADWGGNFYVDVRSPEWVKIVLDEVLPPIIAQRFKGVFMDTLDTAEYLESLDPIKYAGVSEAMVELVRQIHERYPQLFLLSNNGFSLLEEIAPYLSGLIVEDINMMVDFENDSYKKVLARERNDKIRILKAVTEKYGLPVFNIDYVSQEDKKLITECILASKLLGYKPYVAEKDLSRVYKQYE